VNVYPILGIERLLLPIFQRPTPLLSTFAVRFGLHLLSPPRRAVNFIFKIYLAALSKYTCGVLDSQSCCRLTGLQRLLGKRSLPFSIDSISAGHPYYLNPFSLSIFFSIFFFERLGRSSLQKLPTFVWLNEYWGFKEGLLAGPRCQRRPFFKAPRYYLATPGASRRFSP
jgi:hypothetical protein